MILIFPLPSPPEGSFFHIWRAAKDLNSNLDLSSDLPAPKKDKKAPASGSTGGGGFAELWLMKKVFGRYRYAAFAPFFLLAMVSSISTPTPRTTPMMEEMTSGAMSSRAAINRATRSKGLKLRLK